LSILKKSIAGVKWTALSYGIGSVSELVVGIVLARILSPADFGSMAVLGVIILFATSIVNSGFNQSLIRDPEVTDRDYATIFGFNLGMSVVLFLVMILGSGWIAAFYERADIGPYLMVLASVLIIQALGFTPYIQLTRQLDFKRLTQINISATLISGLLAVSAAFLGFGLWALIIKVLTKETMNTAQYYWAIPKRPGLGFSKELFKKHADFGGFFLLSSFVNQIYANILTMILGKYFDLKTLGFYNRSEMVRNLFSQNILGVVTNVSYPALAQVQTDIHKLRAGYLLLQSQSFYLVTIAMSVLFVTADPVVRILLGPQWLESIPILQILCFQGMLQPLTSINMNVFNIVGKPKVYFYFQLAMCLILVPVVLWSIPYGLTMGLVAILGVNFLGMLCSFGLIHSLLGITIRDFSEGYGLTVLLGVLIGLQIFMPAMGQPVAELFIKGLCSLSLILLFGHVLRHKAYQNTLQFINQKK
jgi:teichuronic acid exporter